MGTSQAHWWSNRRCVAIERIGDDIVVYDIGAAFGQNVWVRYPLLSGDDRPSVGRVGRGSMEDAIAESGSRVRKVKKADKKSCEFADRIRVLMASSPVERASVATARFRTLDVERMTSKDGPEGRWLLSSASPKARIHVTAAGADVAEVEARLTALLGN